MTKHFVCLLVLCLAAFNSYGHSQADRKNGIRPTPYIYMEKKIHKVWNQYHPTCWSSRVALTPIVQTHLARDWSSSRVQTIAAILIGRPSATGAAHTFKTLKKTTSNKFKRKTFDRVENIDNNFFFHLCSVLWCDVSWNIPNYPIIWKS